MSDKSIRLIREILRILVLLGAGFFLLSGDEAARGVVVYAVSIVILLAGVSHVLRRLLFPYIDLKQYVDKANDTPLGAAIVFASVVYILSVLIQASTVLLK